MNEETGGPAFPHEHKYGDGTAHRSDGMTLRDYFAAQALAALIPHADGPYSAVSDAYEYADAMIEERK